MNLDKCLSAKMDCMHSVNRSGYCLSKLFALFRQGYNGHGMNTGMMFRLGLMYGMKWA